ncbi:YbaB/EbfC family nucleoid-associated protein [Nocardia asiatica]|uniref:YbaB/EbfC family nucleoid-associated protein n=1 Tax=Nocardia asiatica TaxID=209252 RepID=UPI0002DDADDC|nr:YbaB/EbfC family nucleoid-associated protein [Nocardia asiatica]
MDRWERDGLRSANSGLRSQVHYILDIYERQQAQLTEVRENLETLRVRASSADELAEVTVDSAGVVTEVRLAAAATRGTAERLGLSITEAAQAAARQAQSERDALIAAIKDAADAMPDLPDMVSGAPSWRATPESIDN